MPNPKLEELSQFVISIPEQQLFDLRHRLSSTRWPDDVGNEDWFYGVNGEYLKGLVEYWIDGFDWHAAERMLNGFANYRVTLDDVPIHFLPAPGKGPAPLPLILSHGWPWTYWDWHKVAGPLADPASFGGDPEMLLMSLFPRSPASASLHRCRGRT